MRVWPEFCRWKEICPLIRAVRLLECPLIGDYTVIGSRYGDATIKRLRKFEKIDYRFRKAELDLEFLVRCRDKNVIPRFLNFHLAIRSLISSRTYAQCQSNLLLKVNKLDKRILMLRVLRKEFDNLRSSLQQQINSIDYAHICSKFLKMQQP